MSNGNPDDRSARQLRFDHLTSALTRSAIPPEQADRGRSGRRLILVFCGSILILWGTLYLVFRDWRSRYRERASFGASQVAPAIDPLAELSPPGVDPRSWREAVEATHDMLASVTGANLMDVPQMEALRQELQQTVARARAHPDQAVRELAAVWDSMSDRAGFLLQEGVSGRRKGHPRPSILPAQPVPARKPTGEERTPAHGASSAPSSSDGSPGS